MALSGNLVHIRHFAACGSAGNVVFVEADFDAAPGVLVVSFWTGDDEVCTEASGGEAGGGFGFRHAGFDVADGG